MAPPLLMFIVFVASLVLTMVGLGGSLIFTRLFVLVGFPIPLAAATSLFLNGVAAVSAASVYLRKRMVDFRVAIPLILASVAGAPLGALTTGRMDTRLFTGILAAVILLAGLRMIIVEGSSAWNRPPGAPGPWLVPR